MQVSSLVRALDTLAAEGPVAPAGINTATVTVNAARTVR
jgi:hypothetical protein